MAYAAPVLPGLRPAGLLIAPRDADPTMLAAGDAVLGESWGWTALAEAAGLLAGTQARVWPMENTSPIRLFGGMNVLEGLEIALETARKLAMVTEAIGMPMVFKASFDKANRSSHTSYRGPGMETGLEWLQNVREETGLPVMTDIHEPWQAAPVAEIADILQIPAFLCRQTDLLAAACRTGRPLHIKKMQTASMTQKALI